jgi:NAD(P)H-quinone oxidoreductase subunit 4
MNGAVLQMLSHGLIAAALFFLSGVTYDRTHTLAMDKMGGMAQTMPKVFALFTCGSMASLALPGMSGFVGELSVFLGVTTSDAYNPTFKVVVVLLAAVGLILTPIYLLSMLRQVFYGKTDSGLNIEKYLGDANPREIFITACLLVPIVGIGLYPKLATQTYDVKTVAVAAQVRNALPIVAQEHSRLYSGTFSAPQLPTAKPQKLLGVVK